MVGRRCQSETASGEPCHAPPGRKSDFCFWHDPAKADEAADAQRLGGIRRKRERSVAIAFDFTGLASVESIRRLLEIAATDALSLETDLVEWSKVTALEKLGEGERGWQMARDWLRPQLEDCRL